SNKIDIAGVDIVHRQGGPDEVLVCLVHSHPEQQPLQAGRPSVLSKLAHLEPMAMSRVKSPAHTGTGNQVVQPIQIVLAEAELPRYRRAGDQVEQSAGLNP